MCLLLQRTLPIANSLSRFGQYLVLQFLCLLRKICLSWKCVSQAVRTFIYWARKVRQYVVNRKWGNIRAGRRRNHFRIMSSGWLKTGLARVIILLLTSAKNCSQWANLLWGSDGLTQWLNVLQQANRSTAGAHQSTVSVIAAGTCWARHSCTYASSWLYTPYNVKSRISVGIALITVFIRMPHLNQGWGNPVPLAHKLPLANSPEERSGQYEHFSQTLHLLTWKVVIGCSLSN